MSDRVVSHVVRIPGTGQNHFNSAGPILLNNGQAVTTARFAEPGTYIVRATANDGALSTSAEAIIIVTAQP